MDSSSVTVKTGEGASFRLDTPMRAINGGMDLRRLVARSDGF